MHSKLASLFKTELPIVQAGMVWCSGWKLAAAVSNSGALGLIGAGSMYPETLREHITKCGSATQRPFGVNIPLLYPEIDKIIDVVVKEGVRIVFTSAGNPSAWTGRLKQNGITVVHVVSSVKFAKKAEDAGVDAIVAEGFEAGGHNGREETTTLVLVPLIRDAVKVPVVAAGGISDGRTMLAAMVLGADGVQIGSRFAVSEESSAHQRFKERVVQAGEGETTLTLKQLAPVRLIKNNFYRQVHEAELKGATAHDLLLLLGTRRARRGIFEGDLEEGELEIGQVSAALDRIQPAREIVEEIWSDYRALKTKLCNELP